MWSLPGYNKTLYAMLSIYIIAYLKIKANSYLENMMVFQDTALTYEKTYGGGKKKAN